MIGSASKSVTRNRIAICRQLRPRLFAELGIAWPFLYDAENSRMHFCQDKILSDVSTYDIRRLLLSLGPCFTDRPASENRHLPIVTHRYSEKTTQGKVVMAKMNVDDVDFVVIVKANQIQNSQKDMWVCLADGPKITTPKESYVIICKAYMDATCCMLMSDLVEKHMSPHFPICYAAAVNYVGYKRVKEQEDGAGTLCQTIWMEFLPLSMYEVLKQSKESRRWWSALFQVCAGLTVAQRMYSFIHNDLHCKNVRVKLVPQKTKLYYQTDENVFLEVPTFGCVMTIIDYGRSFVRPWGASKEAVISSVFGSHGECRSVMGDNPSFDLVRLVGSLEDTLEVIDDISERQLIHDFCSRICTADDGSDYFQQLESISKQNINYMLEVFPRKNCHAAIPSKVIPMFYNMYRIENVPEGIVPFRLYLK